MSDIQASRRAGTGPSALRVLSGHTFIYLLGSLCAKVAAILLLPIFTPLLSPQQFGVLELTDATLSLLLQIVGLKLDTAMTRHYFEGSGDKNDRRRVVSTAFLSVSALALLFGSLLFCGADLLAQLLPGEQATVLPDALRLVAVILVAMLITELPIAVLKAERRSVVAVSWQLARLLCELTAKILLVVVFTMGVLGVLLGQAIAAVAFLIGFSIWLLRRYGVAFDGARLRSMVAYSSPMIVAGICGFLLHSADRFMMPYLVDYRFLGLYGIGYRFGSSMTALVLGPFLFIWYPYIFALKDLQRRREVISNAALHTTTVLVALSLPLALFAPEVVRLFTVERFHEAWIYIPVVLFSYLLWGLFQIVQTPFHIYKRTGVLPRVVGAAAVANIGLNLLLMPLLGAMGAALATLLSLLFLVVIARHHANKLEMIPIDWGRLSRLGIVCTVTALLIHVVPLQWSGSLPLRGIALVAGLAYLAGPFLTASERHQLLDLLRALRNRKTG